jgi:hypothetical protein
MIDAQSSGLGRTGYQAVPAGNLPAALWLVQDATSNISLTVEASRARQKPNSGFDHPASASWTAVATTPLFLRGTVQNQTDIRPDQTDFKPI